MKKIILIAMLMALGFRASANHWTPNDSQYANTAAVIGVVSINGEEQTTTDLEVGAFCGDECRGSQMAMYVEALNRYMFFLTLFGNDGDQLTFRLYDHAAGEEPDLSCDNLITFVANATFGSPADPYVFAFEGATATYTVTVAANPAEGGTVSGGGTYEAGQTCTLTATANSGYTFVSWNENGTRVSTEASYTFTVTDDRTLVACFGIPSAGEYVDLGLPSGLLWATCNVGANSPEDYGDYFAWGETQPKSYYDWSTYQYCMGSENTLTKYCNNPEYGYNGYTDDLTVLLPEDDAATANWGEEWRMPTQEEWQELLNNTTSEWTTQNGVSGRLFTAANGASIFLPAVGIYWESENGSTGIDSYYWSNSLYPYDPNGAWGLYFISNFASMNSYDYYARCYGFSVRPVRENNTFATVAVTCNPAEGGTVSGAGSYNSGATCTLTATPNSGYTFQNWTDESGQVVAVENPYTFTVTGDVALVANFVEGSPVAPTENLVAYYPFDGNTNDYSGNGNHGTIIGNVVPAADRHGNPTGAYRFPCEAFNYISVPDAECLHLNSFTLSAWVYSEAEDYGSGVLVNKGRDIVNGSYRLNVRSVGAQNEYSGNNGVGIDEYPAVNQWHMITGTVEGDQARFYVDGVLMAEGTLTHPFSYNNSEPLTLGCHYYNGVPSYWAYTLNGVLDEVRIYSRVMTANEVMQLYNYSEGSLPGLFSVDENAQVQFSKGNLQWSATGGGTEATSHSVADGGTAAGTWRFAEHQYDYIGYDNNNVSPTYSGWIDIFGYGTSGWNSGATYYQPYDTEWSAYGYASGNLEGDMALADWGVYNAISNGGEIPGLWRTLSQAEFRYILNTRQASTVNGTENARYAKAVVNGTNGLVLLPDNYTHPTDLPDLNNINVSNAAFDGNQFSVEQWTLMESAGAVFMPAAGWRNQSGYVEEGVIGRYRTTTQYDNMRSYTMQLSNDYVSAEEGWGNNAWGDKRDGHSVRLVKPLNIATCFIEAVPNPQEGGTIEGAGTYAVGETCTLTATANEGYTFYNWTENGTVVSFDPELSFLATVNRSLVANFVEGDLCALTLEMYDSYGDGWNGNKLTLSYEGVYQEVTLDGGSQGTQAVLLPEGAHITLGWVMGSWTYECSFNLRYANGNLICHGENMSAEFSFAFDLDCAEMPATTFEINALANPAVGGTIEGTGSIGWYDICTLTATANDGYIFANWTENGYVVSTEPQFSFTVTGERTLEANFDEAPFDYHYELNPNLFANTMSVMGVVAINHEEQPDSRYEVGAFCGDECRGRERPRYYASLDRHLLFFTIYGEDGDELSFRLYDHTTGQELDLTCLEVMTFVNDDVVGTPGDPHVFDFLSSYDIAATANPAAGGTIEGAGSYYYGTTATLTATANTGYTFINWTRNGEEVTNALTISFEVTEAAAFVANFSLNTYEITATAAPSNGGTVNGAGTYNYGATCTLTATANTGYTFTNWTKNGTVVSTNATYSFTVTEAAAFVANFTLNTYEITATAAPSNGGTVNGAGTYNHGATCTLTATANTGYTFTNWTKNGTAVSTNASYSFTVTEADDYVANFELTAITQVSGFVQGWNWWSAYVELGNDGLTQLQSGLGTSGEMIKSQNNGYASYLAGFGWYGSLTAINNQSTYQVKANAACTVELTGNATDPADYPITLNSGWSWVGYPVAVSMSVIEALSGIEPMTGDMLKSQNNGYASYLAGFGWYGSLNTLQPGMGLMYKSNNGSAVTLVYPNNGMRTDLKANQTADNNHWRPNLNAYPDNMSVMAVVELDGNELEGENFELAAFANGTVRGSARLLYVEPLNRYMAFLTVAGEDAAELRFGLYNVETGEECIDSDNVITYVTNAVVGSFAEPYVVSFRGTTGTNEWANSLNVYPNPVQCGQNVTIGFNDVETSEMRVEIINAIGAVVETMQASSVQTITAPETAGVYTLRVTVKGKGTCYRKLVVR